MIIFIKNALDALGSERPIFHSEADFQFALATKLKDMWPSKKEALRIRLERSYFPHECENATKPIRLDIEMQFGDCKYAIELKYKTRNPNKTKDQELSKIEIDQELFYLKTHGAQNTGRYDFWKDLQRIQTLIKKENFIGGCVIFLTNDNYYSKEPSNKGDSKNFSMKGGRRAPKLLKWNNSPHRWKNKEEHEAPEYAGKSRCTKIDLEHEIENLEWKDFPEKKMN